MQSREIVWRETSTRVHRMNPDNEVLLSTPPSQRISGVLKENTLCLSLDWDVWGRCVCKLGWWKEGVVAEETMDITLFMLLILGRMMMKKRKEKGRSKKKSRGRWKRATDQICSFYRHSCWLPVIAFWEYSGLLAFPTTFLAAVCFEAWNG